MSDSTYSEDRKRFMEIQEQVKALNLEAEKIILAHQSEDKTEGYGACTYNVCPCSSYVQSDSPAVCGRTHCGHYASDHSF